MTYPSEYKRCMYCEGRLGVPITPDFTQSGVVTIEDELEPEEPASLLARLLRRGMGLVWVLVLGAAAAVRMCSEGG